MNFDYKVYRVYNLVVQNKKIQLEASIKEKYTPNLNRVKKDYEMLAAIYLTRLIDRN